MVATGDASLDARLTDANGGLMSRQKLFKEFWRATKNKRDRMKLPSGGRGLRLGPEPPAGVRKQPQRDPSLRSEETLELTDCRTDFLLKSVTAFLAPTTSSGGIKPRL